MDVVEKEVFHGYSKEDEDRFYPKIEFKSVTLLNHVQKLESEHVAAMAELLAQVEVPVQVPLGVVRSRGSKIFIEKVIVGKDEDAKTYVTGIGKLPNLRRPRMKDNDGGLMIAEDITYPRRNFKRPRVPNWSGPSPFTQAELLQLRRPLVLGWIRDVVLKSADGSGPGQVSYISPDGTMVRSYKDLALALTNYPGGCLSRANFSFTACPIGGSRNEAIRKPPDNSKINKIVNEAVTDIRSFLKTAPPGKRRRSGTAPRSDKFGFLQGPAAGNFAKPPVPRKRRRNIPQKNSILEKMQANDSEGGLFGISALSEIFAGMEKADAERELEEYNHMMSLMAAQENVLEALDPTGGAGVLEDGERVPRDEILPCSIRCPGMTGKIPELQCKRCLCLYHSECLGFPEDIDSTNFLCSNCEGTQSPVASPNSSPVKDSVYDFMEKMLELKKPGSHPNKSTRRGFQAIGKGMSIKRLDQKGGLIPSVGNQRNRRAQPRIPIPQLTSHNLTITPLLPIPRGQIPRVPTLAPINGGPRANSTVSVYRRGKGGSFSNIVDSIQMNPQRQGGTKNPFAPLLPSNKPRKGYFPKPDFGASFGTVKPPTGNIFRNYPQSVVSVGQKKFIVIPCGPPPFAMKIFEKNNNTKPFEEFGTTRKVLTEVFKYLMTKDLVQASRVNKIWRDEATDSKLWKIMRLKNTRIYDTESFGNFVTARGVESIDLRKLMGSVDWSQLFAKLSNAPSLTSLILGSKTEELRELAEKHCPNLEILDSPLQ